VFPGTPSTCFPELRATKKKAVTSYLLAFSQNITSFFPELRARVSRNSEHVFPGTPSTCFPELRARVSRNSQLVFPDTPQKVFLPAVKSKSVFYVVYTPVFTVLCLSSRIQQSCFFLRITIAIHKNRNYKRYNWIQAMTYIFLVK